MSGGRDAVAVIPARWSSSRLPGKPLLAETGKPLVQHVWERVKAARCFARVLVATDDERILATCEGFGAEAVMTRADHPSGTDRMAEVAGQLSEDVLVNVQGDEPEIDPGDLERLVERLVGQGDDLATLARPLRPEETDLVADPNAVKVVCDDHGRALYFSRSTIPHGDDPVGVWLHLGVYAWRREALLRFAAAPPARIELRERLEQLRALTMGLSVGVVASDNDGLGIDTPEDYARFVRKQREQTA